MAIEIAGYRIGVDSRSLQVVLTVVLGIGVGLVLAVILNEYLIHLSGFLAPFVPPIMREALPLSLFLIHVILLALLSIVLDIEEVEA